MGLEAINFHFRSDEEIQNAVVSNNTFAHSEANKYVYKKDNYYWIDLEFQDLNSLSIRVTLCNPDEPVLRALDVLFSFLFSFKGGRLTDLNTKQQYKVFDSEVKEAVKMSYLNRKKIFQEIYGDYTAAISSEEFYRRLTN